MLNVVAIMGRLVADPELRKTPNGVSTTTFTIACDRNYATAGGERQTDFIDIVAWRGTAEFVCKYFAKGRQIAIGGSLQTRTYQDKDGKNRKVYEIVANTVNFADSKNNTSPTAGKDESELDENPTEQSTQTYNTGSPDDFAVIDDSEDLPF